MALITKTIGTSKDYSTMVLWEADSDEGAIYSSGDTAYGKCYDTGAFSQDVVFNGGTSIGLNEVILGVATGEEGDGTAGTGVRIVKTASHGNITQFAASLGYTIEWIELDGNDNGTSAGCCGQTTGVNSADRSKQVIKHCVIHPGTSTTRFPKGINAGTRPMRIINCIVYDVLSTGGSGSTTSFGVGGDDKMDILNCTIFNVSYTAGTGAVFGIGSSCNNAQAAIKNNLVINVAGGSGTTECYDGSLSSVTNKATNGSSDTTGTAGLQSLVAADNFVSPTSTIDLHLKSGADAIDVGTDLGTNPTEIEIDIDRFNRDTGGGTWDLGADEFETSGDFSMPAAQGSYTYTGQSINLFYDRITSAAQGSYTTTGQVTNLLFDKKITNVQGVYTYTGQLNTILTTRILPVVFGSYTYTGQITNLIKTTIMAAIFGSYSVTGQTVGFAYGKILITEAGVYLTSGQTINLIHNKNLPAVFGSYVLTGQAVELLLNSKFIAIGGVYSVSGQNVTLTYQTTSDYTLSAAVGSYETTGQNVDLLYSVVLPVSFGVYTCTGQSVNFGINGWIIKHFLDNTWCLESVDDSVWVQETSTGSIWE